MTKEIVKMISMMTGGDTAAGAHKGRLSAMWVESGVWTKWGFSNDAECLRTRHEATLTPRRVNPHSA